MLFTISKLSRVMISVGVPAGAEIPNHAISSYPGRPASDTVGISGSTDERLGLVTARAFTFPDFMRGSAAGRS